MIRRARPAALVLLLIGALAIPAFAQIETGWPDRFEGSPGAIDRFSTLGYFVWHDGDGWHVRWTTAGRTREFSGVVTTDGRFSDVERIRFERGPDRLNLRDGRTEIHFEARTRGNVDGFDFRTSGRELVFDLQLDGRTIGPDLVRLGRRMVNPERVPFTARRGREAGEIVFGPILIRPRETTGFFIWRDRDVWHMRWTTQAFFAIFSGTVESNRPIFDVRRDLTSVFDEVAAGGNRIQFRAFNNGAVEGFDFRTEGDVVFSLFINGRTAGPGQVFVGARRATPPSVPFVIIGGRGFERRERGEARGWPAFVEGDPGRLSRETRLGYYIWHDDAGWHVRWSTSGGDRTFSGVITTNGELRDIQRVRLERPWDVVRPRGDEIRFRAGNGGWIDGFDFRTTGDRLIFDLQLDGERIRPVLVFLGSEGVHPQGIPFTVTR